MNMTDIYAVLGRFRPGHPAATRRLDVGLRCLAGVVALFALQPRATPLPHDFYLSWMAAQAIKTMPVANIYDPSETKAIAKEFVARGERLSDKTLQRATRRFRRLEFTNSPLLESAVWLASSGDLPTDVRRFRRTCSALFGVGLLALATALGFSGFWSLLIVIGFTLLAWPHRLGALVGNISAPHAGGLLLALALLWRGSWKNQLATGFLLGLLTFLKPTAALGPVLLLTFLAIDRRWESLGAFGVGLAASALVAFAVPATLFGSICTWQAWQAETPQILLNEWWVTGGFFAKLTGVRSSWLISLWAVTLVGTVVALYARTKRRRLGIQVTYWVRDAAIVALGLLINLLSSPTVHGHYFVAAAPAFLVALRGTESLPDRGNTRLSICLVAAILINAHPLLKAMGLSSWPNHGLITFVGVGILLGILLRDLLPYRAAPDPGTRPIPVSAVNSPSL